MMLKHDVERESSSAVGDIGTFACHYLFGGFSSSCSGPFRKKVPMSRVCFNLAFVSRTSDTEYLFPSNDICVVATSRAWMLSDYTFDCLVGHFFSGVAEHVDVALDMSRMRMRRPAKAFIYTCSGCADEGRRAT